jgi:epoxyqueuosine reductase QueG
MGSEELVSITNRVKEVARLYVPWEDAGADLVGIIPAESLDSIPEYWVEWTGAYTKKTTDQLEGARSVVVLGYHASDDIYEAILRKGDRIERYDCLQSGINQRRVARFLRSQGYKARVAGDNIPKKQMARLAGFGNYGKNALIVSPKYGPWIRLGAVITDAEFVYDEPFTDDPCGDCERCVTACPTGALTPFRVDPKRCLVNLPASDYPPLIAGELKYSERYGEVPAVDALFDAHSPMFTQNSLLMCVTCQKACPYGREERGLEPLQDDS